MGGKTIKDRYGNTIYFTDERWRHILESRPELEPHQNKFLETLRIGRRKQDPLVSNKYRYSMRFDELLPENNHLVLIVVFKTQLDDEGMYVPNNFVLTGWAKFIQHKG